MIKVTAKFRSRDLGFDRFIREFEHHRSVSAEAGIFEDAADPVGTKMTMAQLGALHEYGSEKAKIPERSWLRSTFERRSRAWANRVGGELSDYMSRGAGLVMGMALVGEHMASDLRRKITTLRRPRNAKSTIRRKGSSNPLIDTGLMRNSVRGRVTTE